MTLFPSVKSYFQRTVLDFPGFELPAGQTCAVIGANGCGKSTLARLVAGTLSSDSGNPVRDSRLKVGYMPQSSYPFQMTVRKNVLLNGGNSPQDRDRRRSSFAGWIFSTWRRKKPTAFPAEKRPGWLLPVC